VTGTNATVVRVRPAGDADKYGDPTDTDPDRTTLDGCIVAPRTSGDIDDRGRAGVTIGLTLFGPYGTDLLHPDQVEVDGILYDIDGDPGQWKHPRTGREAGMEVALKRAIG
jgi:hypothetical protein